MPRSRASSQARLLFSRDENAILTEVCSGFGSDTALAAGEAAGAAAGEAAGAAGAATAGEAAGLAGAAAAGLSAGLAAGAAAGEAAGAGAGAVLAASVGLVSAFGAAGWLGAQAAKNSDSRTIRCGSPQNRRGTGPRVFTSPLPQL